MPIYSIKAISSAGNKIHKKLEFEDELSLYNYVESAGLNILSIKEMPAIYKYFNLKKLTSKITKREVVEILSNMHVIVKSGLSVHIGLDDIAKDSENPAVGDMLSNISYQLKSGTSLSAAMGRYEHIFTKNTVGLIKIGEETGTLDATLADAAAHIARIDDLVKKTKSALMYPMIAFFALGGAMVFWLVAILPEILGAFSSFNMELPLPTIFVQALSSFMQAYIGYIIGVTVALIIIIKVLRKKVYRFRFETDKLILKIPVIGDLIRYFNLAFFAEYIRLMISAGLPLYQALTVIEESMSNSVFKKAVMQSKASIEEGATFSTSLAITNVFTAIVIRMVNVGEQTGQLEDQLQNIANYYYEKVDYLSGNMAKLIEPVILIFLGCFMAVIMVGLLLPIYDLLGGITR